MIKLTLKQTLRQHGLTNSSLSFDKNWFYKTWYLEEEIKMWKKFGKIDNKLIKEQKKSESSTTLWT